MAGSSGEEARATRRHLNGLEDAAASNPLLLELLLANEVDIGVKRHQQPLLAKEVDIDIKGSQPLLLLNEVDADVQGDDGGGYPVEDRTSLLEASEAGDISILLFLLNKGANVFMRSNDMKTALHFAQSGCVVDILCGFGADINATDNKGNTPLHSAVQGGKVEAIEALLTLGARVDIKNVDTQQIFVEKKEEWFPQIWPGYFPNSYGCNGGCGTSYRDSWYSNTIGISIGLLKNASFVEMYNSYNLNPWGKNNVKELMIKFKQAGYRSDLTDLILGQNCNASDRFAIQCLMEVERLKKVKFGKLSLYDVLIKGQTDCLYAANSEICETIENVQFEQDFPLYNSISRRQLRIAKKRKQILDESVDSFMMFLEKRQNVKLLQDMCLMVFSYLSITDLICLNRALSHDSVVTNNI